MLHQPDEEGKVVAPDALFVKGEDEGTLFGAQGEIGVLDALRDALAGQHGADVVVGDEARQIVVGNFGVDGHAGRSIAVGPS